MRNPIPAAHRPAMARWSVERSLRLRSSALAVSGVAGDVSVIFRLRSRPLAEHSGMGSSGVVLPWNPLWRTGMRNQGKTVGPEAAPAPLAALARDVGQALNALLPVVLDGQDLRAGLREAAEDLAPRHGVHLHLWRAREPARVVVAHVALDAHPDGRRPEREAQALGRIARGHAGRHLDKQGAAGGEDADELAQVALRVARVD